MISCFYYLLRHNRYPFFNRVITKLANIIMPIWYKITPTPSLKGDNHKETIVSFTSFPKRISKVHLVVESILRQRIKPDKIILYLSKNQFMNSSSKNKIPEELKKLKEKGLKIIWVDEDYKSHKKYLYSFRDYKNSNVITIDDDIIYNDDLIASLLSKKNKENITANYVHGIKYDENGDPEPYSYWLFDKNSDSENIILGSGGGAAFTPSTLYPDIVNMELAFSLAPLADDLWLSAMAILNNTRIQYTGYVPKFINISFKKNKTLYEINRIQNDLQIQSINKYYKQKIGKEPYKCPPPPPITSINNIIVSLTTFPARIDKVYITIHSLLRQTMQPKEIILYLSKEQFGDSLKKANLPKKLLALQKKGLKIILVDGDLRSYKKFWYAFQSYPEDYVVTVDDDVIYNSDLLSTLIKFKKDNNVVANLTRTIAKDDLGDILPYSKWHINSGRKDKNNIVIGVGGVMYTPYRMNKDTLRIDLFMKLAPYADDLWLSAMAKLNDLEIVPTEYPNKFIPINIPNNKTLFSQNKVNNDNQYKAINEYYKKKIDKVPFA